MKKQQSGFTLIELVIVIVILGLLAATALPRFADLADDAREAKRDGIEGAVRSAAAIYHAEALAEGKANNTTETVAAEDGTTIALDYRYPDAVGITAAVEVSDVTPTTDSSGVVTWTVATDCTVTYTAATSVASPVVSGDTTCG